MSHQISIYSDGGARGNPGPAGIGVVIKVTSPLIPTPPFIPPQRKNATPPLVASRGRDSTPLLVPTLRLESRAWKFKKFIGTATNNEAEYLALISSLEKVLELKSKQGLEISKIKCYLDSELVVKQLNLKYKVKNLELSKLFIKVWNLKQKLGLVEFIYIPRSQNKEADNLVNEAIDESLN